MTTLNEYAMKCLWESIANDDVKEAVFWLGVMAAPEPLTEALH